MKRRKNLLVGGRDNATWKHQKGILTGHQGNVIQRRGGKVPPRCY